MLPRITLIPNLTVFGARFCRTLFGVRIRILDLPQEWVDTSGRHPINLSYHWKNLSGEVIIWDGIRTPLPLDRGLARIEVDVLVRVPEVPGVYLLEITGVRESLCWWEAMGVSAVSLEVSVESIEDSLNTILLAGGSGFRNAGDEALLRSATELCQQQAPDSRMIVSANDPRVAIDTLEGLPVSLVSSLRVAFFRGDSHYGLCDDVFIKRWRIIERTLNCFNAAEMIETINFSPELDFIDREESVVFLSALSAANTLVIHGGGILTSSTRSRLWEMALLCRLAHNLGVKIALRSHQLGPYSCLEDITLARQLFDQADFISTRDCGESWFAAVATGTTANIAEDVDDAYLLDYTRMDKDKLTDLYELQPNSYVCACFRRNQTVGVTENALNIFVEVVEYAALRSGKLIVLLPMGPFDVDVLKNIQLQLKVRSKLIIPHNWFVDPPGIAQHASFVISLPHHPLIFALQSGTPILSPVEGRYYCAKNRGSMRWFSLEHFVVDINEPEATQALKCKVDLLAEHNDSIRAYILRKRTVLDYLVKDGRDQFRFFLNTPPPAL